MHCTNEKVLPASCFPGPTAFRCSRPEHLQLPWRLSISFPRLSSVPPLNTGMPFNVLIGYVYIDSFARSTSEVSLTSFLDNLTYSDTSRKALSYLYQMDDFDPIRYFQYGISVPTSAHYQTIPVQLMHKFGRFLSKVFPDSGHAAALYYPDYMLDILVTDTVSKGDSLAAISKSCVGVSAVVIDTIKGRVLPPFSTSYVNKSQNIQPQTSLPMIGFDYRPDRIRVSRAGNDYAKGSITIAADHSPWIKKRGSTLYSSFYRIFIRATT